MTSFTIVGYASPQVVESIELHKRRYGDEHWNRVSDQCIEEMAELIKELQKKRRGVGDRGYEIVSEMGDVQLCFEHLREALDVAGIELQDVVSKAASNLSFFCRFELAHEATSNEKDPAAEPTATDRR